MAKSPWSSLEEALGDAPPEKLDQPCQDKHLCLVAREITNWPFLAPFLGIKAPVVEAIRGKWPFNVPAQNLELLRQWQCKHQSKQKDMYRNLCKAFLEAQERALADKVCDILRGQGSITETSSDEDDEMTVGTLFPMQTPPSSSASKIKSKERSKLNSTSSMLYCVDPPTPATVEMDPLEQFADYL